MSEKKKRCVDLRALECGNWIVSETTISAATPRDNSEINGIFINKTEHAIEIVNDTFGTLPVFFDIKKCVIYHDLEFVKSKDIERRFDKAGLWESIIFDFCFNNRTLYKDILHLPGGVKLFYRFSDDSFEIKRWNFFTYEEIERPEELIEKRLTDLCEKYWSELPKDGDILLPLSGGLDSRLLAIYLAESGDVGRIKAVTFGSSKKSQEYIIAKKVCEILGIKNHVFHSLPRNLYWKEAFTFWPDWKGLVSVLHMHLNSFLNSIRASNFILISGFYADPVSGYAASREVKDDLPLESQPIYKRLLFADKELRLPSEVFLEIYNDLRELHDEWKASNPKMDFSEYVYLSQRQAKTFSLLLSMYKKKCKVKTPFADPVLSKLFLSTPFILREKKKIIRKLILRKNEKLFFLDDLSSAIPTDTFKDKCQSVLRKWSSRLSITAAIMTKDLVRPFCPFWTEDILGALRVENRKKILSTLDFLLENKILDEKQFVILRKKPIRSYQTVRLARILSLFPIIKNEQS